MKRLIAAALAATFLFSGAASAEDYPTRAVTIVVPFAPGGILDIAARVVGERLQQKWGQPVVIENRAGASGMIGAQAAAKAKPDGYTLFMAETGVAIINGLIFKTVSYDMEKDFTPIMTLTDTPIVVAVNAQAGINSMKELLEKAKKSEVDFASPAAGTLNHLTGEWIALETGTKLRHIGYKGGAPAATAVAGGEVPVAVLAYSSAKPFVDGGRVKLVAVTDAKRVAADPNLPTLQESGVPNVASTQWAGLFAPAGTPQPIIDKIQKDVTAILGMPEVKEKLAAVGAAPIPSTPAAFAARIKTERAQLEKIVKAAKIAVN